MAFNAGEQVGPYRVIEQLGRGGMATVYKAYHANLDRYVALKVLHPAFMEDPNFEARFQREARVVAKLEHSNIIPVHDFAEHDGRSYLVMKYVEGQTLKARLNDGGLSPEEGVNIIQNVGAALSYAHKQGVLHRDVKPSNVMISEDGRIFLADFGLARIASAGESTLSSDMMIGTPQYISPEQAMGKRDLDDGTDIYSFGVLIYELVVGQVPFSSDTPFSIVHDHIYAPLPLPRAVNSNVPQSVERVLLKALAKERDDRFGSVNELVDAFTRAVEGEEMPEIWAESAVPTPTAPPVAGMAIKAVNNDQNDATVMESQSEEISTAKEGKSWREKLRWWYIFPALAFCFICFLVLSAIGDDQEPADNFVNNAPNVVNNEFDEYEGGEYELDPDSEDQLYSDLDEAWNYVDENPEDPFGYLWLAEIYVDLGDDEEAVNAFDEGAAIAGDDPGYYRDAGDILSVRGLWFEALQKYLISAQFIGEPDPELSNLIRQAMFHAAEDESARFFFMREAGGNLLDRRLFPYIPIVQARFTLLHEGDPGLALSIIEEQDNIDTAEARLVMAEILIELGEIDEAREHLEWVIQGRHPEWTKAHARMLLSEIER